MRWVCPPRQNSWHCFLVSLNQAGGAGFFGPGDYGGDDVLHFWWSGVLHERAVSDAGNRHRERDDDRSAHSRWLLSIGISGLPQAEL